MVVTEACWPHILDHFELNFVVLPPLLAILTNNQYFQLLID